MLGSDLGRKRLRQASLYLNQKKTSAKRTIVSSFRIDHNIVWIKSDVMFSISWIKLEYECLNHDRTPEWIHADI